MKTCVRVLVLLLGCSFPALAGDWPNWRGPFSNGHAPDKDLPLTWSATENVRWKVQLPDWGNSTPIVVGKRVFITQASERADWPPKPGTGGIASAYRRAVMCFDRVDGKLLWNREIIYKEKESTHPTNPFCSASPVSDGEIVVALHGSAGAVCYDLDGKELWRHEVGKLEQVWGNASSPILYKNLVILWCGPGARQFLRAVDKKTGLKIWEHEEPGGAYGDKPTEWLGSWCTPIVIRVDDHDELILAVPEKLKGFDPQTGKELWSCDGAGKLAYTSPTYSDGIVVLFCGYGGPALAVRPGGKGDVTKTHRVWHHPPKPGQRIGSPVVVDGRVYLLNENGVFQCFDLKTGKDLWNQPRVEGKSWSALVAAAGRIYVPNHDGDIFVVSAGTEFERLAKNSLGKEERTLSSIAVSDGELFIRTYKHLWCIGKK